MTKEQLTERLQTLEHERRILALAFTSLATFVARHKDELAPQDIATYYELITMADFVFGIMEDIA